MTLERTEQRPADWRWLIAFIVLAYAMLIAGAGCFQGGGGTLLQALGVPALEAPLMDLRGVAVWCDAWAQGSDPAVAQTWIILPGGGKHPNFLMNYSPLVLGLGKLGLTETTASFWGIGLALLYLGTLGVLCGRCSLRQALLWAFLICSPASVLVIERGNLDELIFALLILALVLRKQPLLAPLVILAASCLKFFPILSLIAPWKASGEDHPEQIKRGVVITALLFLGFLVLIRSRLLSIGGSLGGQYQSAFGFCLPADLLIHHRILMDGAFSKWLRILLRIIACSGILGGILAGVFFWRESEGVRYSERARHAFLLTAPVMLALFVQGPQMDYKWIFFLPMVPLIVEMLSSDETIEALSAKIWIGGMGAYSYWTLFSDEGCLRNALLKQSLMWIVIFLSALLLGRIWNQKSA